MITLATVSFVCFGVLLVLFGASSFEIIESLGLDYAEFGLLGSMLAMGLGVGIVAAGPLVDRLPRRPLFLAACAIVAAATLGIDSDIGFRALLVRAAAIGAGAGLYETLLNAIVIETGGERAARRMVLAHSGATLGAMIAPLAVNALQARYGLEWSGSFRIAGWLHVGLACWGAFAAMPGPARARPARSGMPAGPPAPERPDVGSLVAICAATFSYVGIEATCTLFVGQHAREVLGLDGARADASISAFWAGLLVGRLAILAPRRPPGPGSIAVLAGLGAGLASAYGLGLVTVPEAAMAAMGFLLGGVFPIMISLAGTTLPAATGMAVGLAGGLGSVGGFVIPWCTGWVADATDLGWALTSIALWMVGLVAAASVVWRRGHRPRRSHEVPASSG